MTIQRLQAVAFDWHNYGKSTIGARTDIEQVNVDHLRAFYHRYYAPDNAILVVAGKFDEGKALARINQAFGPLKNPQRVLEPTYTRSPSRMVSAASRSAAWAARPCSWWATTSPQVSTRRAATWTWRPTSWPTAPPAASTRPWWRPNSRPRSSRPRKAPPSRACRYSARPRPRTATPEKAKEVLSRSLSP
ncbi:MAG: insulinase family protein [Holophagaceae bacterium]|nr:insulinase family protein [Holophagaceae bacterium]